MRNSRILPALLAALLLGPAAVRSAPLRNPDTGGDEIDVERWVDGPIRYIARKEEVKTFKALDTDSDRLWFIEKFWSRRDPSPETLTNEYRQMFWERVRQANDNFIDSSKPGWLTDRGKVHILYGPPTEVQQDIHLETVGPATGGRGVIRWIYEGRPGQRMDLDPIVVVPFVGDPSGEYRLSTDPELASVFWDPNAIREKTFSQKMLEKRTGSRVLRRSELSVMLDLGKMQEVPPQEQVLLESVETTEAYRTHPIAVRTGRYFDAESDRTVFVLTVDLHDAGRSDRPAVIARLTPLDATRETRLLGEGSFRFEERGDLRLAQGRVALEPGGYSLTVMLADPELGTTGMHRETLTIPEVNRARLRFSDLTWAAELEPLAYASLASHTEPFIVGAFRVLPETDDDFRPGDTLRLFYEVYDARLPLMVRYQVQGREDDGRWIDLGAPQSAEQGSGAQGWELVTSPRWPVGDYRVKVEVQDAEGRLLTTQIPFRLAATETS